MKAIIVVSVALLIAAPTLGMAQVKKGGTPWRRAIAIRPRAKTNHRRARLKTLLQVSDRLIRVPQRSSAPGQQKKTP